MAGAIAPSAATAAPLIVAHPACSAQSCSVSLANSGVCFAPRHAAKAIAPPPAIACPAVGFIFAPGVTFILVLATVSMSWPALANAAAAPAVGAAAGGGATGSATGAGADVGAAGSAIGIGSVAAEGPDLRVSVPVGCALAALSVCVPAALGCAGTLSEGGLDA